MSTEAGRRRSPGGGGPGVAGDLARGIEVRVFAPAAGAKSDTTFHARVWAVVRLVPAGRVTTYGDVGAILGSPRVARQVGWALAALPEGSDVPWQRVVNAAGRISGSPGAAGPLAPRAALQAALLAAEGVVLDARGRLDLARLRWHYPDVVVPFRVPAEGASDDQGAVGASQTRPRSGSKTARPARATKDTAS